MVEQEIRDFDDAPRSAPQKLAPSIPLLTWDNSKRPTSGVNDIIITSWDQV
ncbi:hypothetical protein RB2083_792 [Rhodobacteraceae bacterium HTCC2083]|nr:hypothetical protein RB2083_792 [Rhodobacteraceae bacterium HTCC2083]